MPARCYGFIFVDMDTKTLRPPPPFVGLRWTSSPTTMIMIGHLNARWSWEPISNFDCAHRQVIVQGAWTEGYHVHGGDGGDWGAGEPEPI